MSKIIINNEITEPGFQRPKTHEPLFGDVKNTYGIWYEAIIENKKYAVEDVIVERIKIGGKECIGESEIHKDFNGDTAIFNNILGAIHKRFKEKLTFSKLLSLIDLPALYHIVLLCLLAFLRPELCPLSIPILLVDIHNLRLYKKDKIELLESNLFSDSRVKYIWNWFRFNLKIIYNILKNPAHLITHNSEK